MELSGYGSSVIGFSMARAPIERDSSSMYRDCGTFRLCKELLIE